MEPTQFGNYTLVERISHGGMAEVYRAKSFGEAGFEREVALKLLLPAMASDAEFVNMLIDEAKIAGQLNHANIAQIFDLGVTDGRYYIVQEYVSGQDLRAILQYRSENNTPLDVSTSCHIALKISEGLYYAHNKQDPSGRPLNLVHRDISPHNILISNEGEVKIIDFGIAKAEGRSTQTMAGLVKGKFAYMSPEQIRGLPVDHRSDVFATGILLHEMLSNQSLFRRSSEFETLKRARSAIAEPPSQFNTRVPPALDKITLKALARHVDDRYQSALELRDALWAFAREHNSFSEPNAFARARSGDIDPDSSIEIELAFEVSKVIETQRSADNVRDYSYDLEDSEVEESEPGNATMVDPRLPFGSNLPGNEDTTETGGEQDIFTPTDHDAQWARDVGGPLGSSSPFAMPTLAGNERRTKRIVAIGEEETTSDRGEKQDRPTDLYAKLAPFPPDEATAEKVAVIGDRSPTVSGKPGRDILAAVPVAGRPRSEAEAALGVAATQPVSRAALGQAPTQAIPSIALTPTPMLAALPSNPPQAQPGYSQPGYAPPGFPNPSQPGYPPSYPQQGYGPETYPQRSPGLMPAYPRNDQSAPYPYSISDSGSAPYSLPVSGSESMVMGPAMGFEQGSTLGPQRLYLVMTAIFVLLLAGAATITLIITG